MSIFKKITTCLVLPLLCMSLFAGCTDNNDTNNPEDNTEPKKYNLIATLDSSSIDNYYASGSTIHITNQGAVTISLEDENEIETGFIWNLSNYKLKCFTEYVVKFKNLTISGFNAITNYSFSVRLNWQDSSYNYLRYYNTKTHYFGLNIDNNNRHLYLDSFENDEYEIKFKFNHFEVNNSDIKFLYFDFTGIESCGTISFDSVALYEFS